MVASWLLIHCLDAWKFGRDESLKRKDSGVEFSVGGGRDEDKIIVGKLGYILIYKKRKARN